MQVARSGACAAELGGRLYVCGGLGREGALRSVEIFDPDTGRWEQGPTLRGPRFSAVTLTLTLTRTLTLTLALTLTRQAQAHRVELHLRRPLRDGTPQP